MLCLAWSAEQATPSSTRQQGEVVEIDRQLTLANIVAAVSGHAAAIVHLWASISS